MPPFIPPLAEPNNVNISLANERAKVTFPIEAMTRFLIGPNLEKIRKIRTEIESNPVFSNADKPFLSREQGYVRALQKATTMLAMGKKNNWGEEEIIMAQQSIGDSTPLYLDSALFVPTLKSQLSDEQLKIWLPRCEERKEIFGCYAQTELGHGSNLRKLETTATFIPDSDEWELETPTLTSMKWWPGALARSSNFAAVYARMVIAGKDYGVHPFLLQIRAFGTHQPMPNVEIGDIGPKIGFNNIDNGFLRINKVRIPREQLMMRNVKVHRDGTFEPAKHAKLGYATMVKIRAAIISDAGRALGIAATIAIRYSMVRVQGGDKLPSQNHQEVKVIDHAMQRFRLTTTLASSYAMLMTGKVMMDLYNRNLANIAKGEIGMMAQVHATSTGLKALTSDIACEAMEDARRSCGGHGYNHLSGLPELCTVFLQNITVEGENTILHLQTARWLIKTVLQSRSTKSFEGVPSGLVPYLKTPKRLQTDRSHIEIGKPIPAHVLVSAFYHREARILMEVVQRVMKDGGGEEAFAKSMVELVELSRAHCEGILVRNFFEALEHQVHSGEEGHGCGPVLDSLAELYAIHRLILQTGDFVEDGYISMAQMKWCKERRRQLIDGVRDNLVGLVDAYDFTDNQLNSALGRYDGRVYESLYEWAKYGMSIQPKGNKGGVLGHDEVLKDLFEGRPGQSKL